jgi:hypothetical protein
VKFTRYRLARRLPPDARISPWHDVAQRQPGFPDDSGWAPGHVRCTAGLALPACGAPANCSRALRMDGFRVERTSTENAGSPQAPAQRRQGELLRDRRRLGWGFEFRFRCWRRGSRRQPPYSLSAHASWAESSPKRRGPPTPARLKGLPPRRLRRLPPPRARPKPRAGQWLSWEGAKWKTRLPAAPIPGWAPAAAPRPRSLTAQPGPWSRSRRR